MYKFLGMQMYPGNEFEPVMFMDVTDHHSHVANRELGRIT